MTNRALIALLDVLLPGDDGVAGGAPLPAFSAADVEPTSLEGAAQPILGRIAAARFAAATVAERKVILQDVARAAPEDFRSFLGRALAAYYQSRRVTEALGWRNEPPQPTGHRLSAGDETTWRLLDKVRARGAIWRG